MMSSMCHFWIIMGSDGGWLDGNSMGALYMMGELGLLDMWHACAEIHSRIAYMLIVADTGLEIFSEL